MRQQVTVQRYFAIRVAFGFKLNAVLLQGQPGAEFCSLYEAKYGLLHPVVFMEDYAKALLTAKAQGRLVLVYVYSDYEVNDVCLCSHKIRNVLTRLFLNL